jgi:hypothetical protein
MAGFSVYIGADTAQLTAGLNQATAEVQKFSSQLTAVPAQALNTLNTVVQSTVAQFDELAASAAALDRINASIDAAGDAAIQAGSKFDTLGGRLPLQDFNAFKSSIDRLKSDISSGLLPQISRVPSALAPIAPAATNVAKGANQATQALTNIGRVAQDLPFGFIGIANNLNPLLESFQRLRAETGSGKAAMQALGSSLMGAGGIGIALSAVTAILSFSSIGLQAWGVKAKKAKEEADEFAKSIRSIGLIEGEARASVEGQISQVNALAAAISDSNKPYTERKRALEELKDINKSYFNDLKLEDAATGALTKTIQEYTNALINSAIQKQFVDEIATVAKKVAEQDDIISKSRLKLAQAQRELANVENLIPTGTRDPEAAKNKLRLEAIGKVTQAQKELGAENEKVTALLVQEALVRDRLNRAVGEGLKYKDLDTQASKKEEDLLKKRLEALEKIKAITKDATTLVGLQEAIFELQVKIAVRDQGKNKLSKQELDQQLKGYQDQLNEAFKNQAIELESIPKVKFSSTARLEINDIISKAFTSKDKIILSIGEKGVEVNVKKESVDVTDLQGRVAKATGLDKKIPIPTQFEIDVKFLGLRGAQLKKAKEEIELKLSETIAQIQISGKIDIATQIGDALGESLASGNFGEGLKKAAKGILGVLGDLMQQIGKQVVTAALAIKALKVTLEKFAIANPGLAVIAGIGLIAAGAALKNIKFDGPKFATGGIVTGPVIGQIGEMHRPEVIMPLDRLPQMLRSIGGGTSGDTQPVLIFTNEGLYLQMKRGERRANRKF